MLLCLFPQQSQCHVHPQETVGFALQPLQYAVLTFSHNCCRKGKGRSNSRDKLLEGFLVHNVNALTIQYMWVFISGVFEMKTSLAIGITDTYSADLSFMPGCYRCHAPSRFSLQQWSVLMWSQCCQDDVCDLQALQPCKHLLLD